MLEAKKLRAFITLKFAAGLMCFLILFLGGRALFSASQTEKKPTKVISPETAKMTTARKAVDSEIDAFSARMAEMIDWMYNNPEPGFEEFKATDMLTSELKKNGFEVEMNVPGLDPNFDKLKILGGFPPTYSGPKGIPTAFKARYKGKSEHPVVGFAVEYDALRGNPPYHGCQHNMQGPSGIAAAIAVAKIMEKNSIPGSVWVIGKPAEEVAPSAFAYMAKVGYLEGIDFMIRSHGTPAETLRFPGGFSSRHIWALNYTFHGKPAHGQQAWEGVSALDAVMLLFHGIEMLREHSEPQFRIHGVVTEGGVAPNIVPEKASAGFWIRHLIDNTPVGFMSPAKAKKLINDKVTQMDNIAKGAALATGTTVDIDHYDENIPGISVGTLNDIAFQYAVDYGGIKIGDSSMPNQWEETGFGSLLVPGTSTSIAIEGIPEVAGHSQESAKITISPEGHKSAVLTAKVMAATQLRLLMDPNLQKKAKEEHAKLVAKYNE